MIKNKIKVNGKIEDRMLKDLFRQTLENVEITPSEEAGANLMRKVGRKEFLRFNPSRFNIWYAGSIAVAGAALVILLSAHNVKPGTTEGSVGQNAVEAPVTPSSNNISTAQQSDAGSKTHPISSGKPPKGKPAKNPTLKSTRQLQSVTGVSEPSVSGIINPVNEKENIKGSVSGSVILRGLSQSFVAMAGTSFTEGCAPLKVLFKNLSQGYDSCRWTFGDGGSSVGNNPTWLFDVPGEYKVTLTISGTGNQHASTSLTVTVHSRPDARFELSPANAILPTDEISFHNYSGEAAIYRWDFGDGTTSDLFEPSHTYSKAGRYNIKMVASNEFGCSDSITLKNAFSGSGNYINFPNAFIPNLNGPSTGYYSQKSDEAAQVFHPVSSGVSEYQLRIFSRRGILIFESNDVNIGWDGYMKGQLCEPGVYIWKSRGTFLNGETFTRMGDVTLLKY